MDDITTYALLTASFFFVAVAFALLFRYRQISQRINASNDLGYDLWSSLEARLKKQDERILDLMGRLEVIQARVLASAAQAPPTLSPLPVVAPPSPVEEKPAPVTEHPSPTQQPESQPSQPSAKPPEPGLELDDTQMRALQFLKDAPKSTREIVNALGKSREHTARLMKELFEAGLVTRNDASKPFVYQLTDEAKRRVGSQ